MDLSLKSWSIIKIIAACALTLAHSFPSFFSIYCLVVLVFKHFKNGFILYVLFYVLFSLFKYSFIIIHESNIYDTWSIHLFFTDV